MIMDYDVIVIGAGLAGLMAAARAAAAGRTVLVLARGQGVLALTSGCIDILGWLPGPDATCLTDVAGGLQRLAASAPDHPYAKIGPVLVQESIAYWQQVMQAVDYPYCGSGAVNYLLPTALGAVRPTALAPATMAGGDIRDEAGTLVVGWPNLLDWHPRLIADGINQARRRLGLGGVWSSVLLDALPGTPPELTPVLMGRFLEDDWRLESLIAGLRGSLTPGAGRVALPAVLGVNQGAALFRQVEKALGCPVFEIPAGQPTVTGLRLAQLLTKFLKQSGVEFRFNVSALSAENRNDAWQVRLDRPGRVVALTGGALVLATGGLIGRGLEADRNQIRECVAGLPVAGRDLPGQAREQSGWGRDPFTMAGVVVDGQMRPLAADGDPGRYRRLFVAGSTLAGYDPAVEKDGLGVALATGYVAGNAAAKEG
jgi:glycerol-3-phosphate dehydrogenase subunit B